MSIEVIHLCSEGLTLSMLAKGNIETEAMKQACIEQFIPSEYEDEKPNLDNATICRGVYRWIPQRDEFGDFCGMKLHPAQDGSRGSFYATELILN